MCLEVAYPLASVRARIGRHIVSFATLIKLYSKTVSYKDNEKLWKDFILPVNNLIQ